MTLLLKQLSIHRQAKSRLIAPHAKYPKGFVLVENHYELSLIQEYWNRGINPEAFERWTYWYTIGEAPVGGPYSDLRLGKVGERYVTPRSRAGHAPYFIPAGLQTLEDLLPYGFAADYQTCSECSTPLGEHHTKGFVSDTLYCADHLPLKAYIQERINNSTHAVDPTLVDLAQHGWTVLPHEFANGPGAGRFNIPHDVLTVLQPLGLDVIFSFIDEEFATVFYAWIQDSAKIPEAMALIKED